MGVNKEHNIYFTAQLSRHGNTTSLFFLLQGKAIQPIDTPTTSWSVYCSIEYLRVYVDYRINMSV